MNGVDQVIAAARRAARRALLRDTARRSGRALLIGAGAALVLILADRLAGGLVSWPWLLGLPVGACLAGAVAWSVVRRPGLIEAAAEVDGALRLKDRLSSALAFRGPAGVPDAAFAEWAVRDGAAAAASARLDKAIPVRLDWTWMAWPVVAAAGLAGALFVPSLRWSAPAATTVARTEARTRAAAIVEEAAQTARDVLEAETGDLATPEELRVIEDLRAQLDRGVTDPDSAIVQAASQLEDLSRRLAAESEQRRLEQEALSRRLASGTPDETEGEAAPEGGSATDALEEALRAGDVNAAREAAEALAQEAPTWTPEQRDAFTRDLERLAGRLVPPQQPGGEPGGAPNPEGAPPVEPPPQPDQPPEPDEPPVGDQPRGDDAQPGGEQSAPQPFEERTRRELEERGITPEQQRDLERRITPEDARRELERRGMDPDAARRLGERIARENQERQAERTAEERMRDLRRSLKDAAREIREQPQDQPGERTGEERAPDGRQPGARGPDPRAPEGATPSEQQGREGEHRGRPGDPRQPGESPRPQPGQQPADQPRPGDEPGAQPKPQPGDQPGREGGEQPRPQPGQQPGDQPRPGDEPGTQPKPQPGDQPGREGGEQPRPQPGQQPGDQPRPGNDPGTQPQPQPGDQPGRDGGEQPAPEPGGQSGTQPRSGEQPGGEPTEQTPGGEGQQPGEREGEGEGQRPEGGDQGKGPGRGWDRLRRTMDALGQAQRDAERQREQAERLREQAEEMLRQASPEEREEMRRWAESMLSEGGPREPSAPVERAPAEFGSEPVDARRSARDRSRESVVAQWFTDQPVDREGAPGRAVMDEQIRDAAAGAERAIEQQVVPNRYSDLVRRVFRRYGERAAAPPGPQRAP